MIEILSEVGYDQKVQGYLIGTLIVLSLLGTNCGRAEEREAEKVIEEAIKTESGGEVDAAIDSKRESVTIETSDGKVEMITGSKAK